MYLRIYLILAITIIFYGCETTTTQIKNENIKKTIDFVDNKKTERQSRICDICSSYSVSHADDAYMAKFKCCFNCYIQHIEGREERWNSGWRPNG